MGHERDEDQEIILRTDVYRFCFARSINMMEAEATLQLAILASEGLFGEARVRIEVSYLIDAPRCVIVVDGGTPSGVAVARIFAAFLTREFGADGFSVRAVPSPAPVSASRDAA